MEAIHQTYVLEATWSNCPEEVVEEIRQLWCDHEYGNDNYYHGWDWEGCDESFSKEVDKNNYEDCFKYPLIRDYLISKGLKDNGVLIRYWW